MPTYYDINGTLLSQDEYLETHKAVAAVNNGERASLSLGADRTIRKSSVKPALVIADPEGTHAQLAPREFTPIGLGKPLTMWITSAYAGNAPSKWGRKGGLLSSAVKSWNYNDAKPRALNALNKAVGRGSEFQLSAIDPGTPLAFYSPALVDRSLITTFEMAFDNVDEPFYTSIGDVLSTAGTLPVFAAAAPYLLAVGSLFKIGAKIANALYDSKAEFQATEALNIALPGVPAEAGYRLLTRTPLEHQTLAEFEVRDGKLRKKSDSSIAYAGPTPYIIVALDGTPDTSLEGFAATAASAALLERFYNVRENGETSSAAFVEALKLFNDFRYSREALEIKRRLEDASLSPDERTKLEERYTAITKNILTDEFKPKGQ